MTPVVPPAWVLLALALALVVVVTLLMAPPATVEASPAGSGGATASQKKSVKSPSPPKCGAGWQQPYRRLHESAARLLNSHPPSQWEERLEEHRLRMTVALVREGKFKGQFSGGVGDRFTGLITVFALALLNDVPFFLDFPRLSSVLDSGNGKLDWALNTTGYITYHGYDYVRTTFPFWRQWQYLDKYGKTRPTSLHAKRRLSTVDKNEHRRIYSNYNGNKKSKKGNSNSFSIYNRHKHQRSGGRGRINLNVSDSKTLSKSSKSPITYYKRREKERNARYGINGTSNKNRPVHIRSNRSKTSSAYKKLDEKGDLSRSRSPTYFTKSLNWKEMVASKLIDQSKYTAENQYHYEHLLTSRRISVIRNLRGHIMQLFQEGKYASRLAAWGLTRENMYGCLFDYLFAPGGALRSSFQEEVAQLTNPRVLKVLVQIRVGDKEIGPAAGTPAKAEAAVETPFSRAAAAESLPPTVGAEASAGGMEGMSLPARNMATAFFTCATLIEEAALAAGTMSASGTYSPVLSRISRESGMGSFNAPPVAYTGVLWYLMTDSNSIKKYAREKYGSKVVMHDSRLVNMLGNTKGYDMRSLADVIGEQWCGSLCNYFVTSATSGLGMQAAFRSKRVDYRAFPVDTHHLSSEDVYVVSNSSELNSYLQNRKKRA